MHHSPPPNGGHGPWALGLDCLRRNHAVSTKPCAMGLGPAPNPVLPQAFPRPRWPPNLIWLVLLVNLLVFLLILLVNLLIFWDWIACELITLFVIFFHAIISPDYRFSWETPFSGSSRIRDDTRISGIWMRECIMTTCYLTTRTDFSRIDWRLVSDSF